MWHHNRPSRRASTPRKLSSLGIKGPKNRQNLSNSGQGEVEKGFPTQAARANPHDQATIKPSIWRGMLLILMYGSISPD